MSELAPGARVRLRHDEPQYAGHVGVVEGIAETLPRQHSEVCPTCDCQSVSLPGILRVSWTPPLMSGDREIAWTNEHAANLEEIATR